MDGGTQPPHPRVVCSSYFYNRRGSQRGQMHLNTVVWSTHLIFLFSIEPSLPKSRSDVRKLITRRARCCAPGPPHLAWMAPPPGRSDSLVPAWPSSHYCTTPGRHRRPPAMRHRQPQLLLEAPSSFAQLVTSNHRHPVRPSAAALRTHHRTSIATKDLATSRPASPQFLLPLWWCGARWTNRRGLRRERKKRGSGSTCLYRVYFIFSVRLEHL